MIWRILWPLVLASFLALFSVNFLLGLPGALLMDVVLRAEVAAGAAANARAMAILVSFLAPFGIVPTLWAMMAWRPGAAWWQWVGTALAGYLVAGAVAAVSLPTPSA